MDSIVILNGSAYDLDFLIIEMKQFWIIQML